ncbi:MAG: hypothetical protein IPL61_14940 [Myxococcales bacterium]|nr:hypothetical protein [Myxococcales bacterium]
MRRLVVVLILSLSACGHKPAAKPAADAPAVVAPPPAPAVDAAPPPPAPAVDAALAPTAAVPRGPNLYLLDGGDVRVDLTMMIPPGWREDAVGPRFEMRSDAGSVLAIELGCQGTCVDDARTRARVTKAAQDGFAAAPGAAWDRAIAELRPGVLGWAFHSGAGDQLAVAHLIPTPRDVRVLSCTIALVPAEHAHADALAQVCAELDYVVPDPRITWTLTVTPATVALARTATVDVRIAATNHAPVALSPARDPLEFTIDGQPSMELAMAFGNGGRGGEWTLLPAGATARDRRVGMELVTTPGVHVLAIAHNGRELARATLRVRR